MDKYKVGDIFKSKNSATKGFFVLRFINTRTASVEWDQDSNVGEVMPVNNLFVWYRKLNPEEIIAYNVLYG
jgi:hypothetical protein